MYDIARTTALEEMVMVNPRMSVLDFTVKAGIPSDVMRALIGTKNIVSVPRHVDMVADSIGEDLNTTCDEDFNTTCDEDSNTPCEEDSNTTCDEDSNTTCDEDSNTTYDEDSNT